MDEAVKEFYDRIAVFTAATMEACADVPDGKNKAFTCPLCGGTAVAFKSKYNGHHHARCSKCGFSMAE